MPKQNINIQDGFLFQNLKNSIAVKIELMTGTHLDGTIRRFDRFALVLESGGNEILIYKHAIATIEATEPV